MRRRFTLWMLLSVTATVIVACAALGPLMSRTEQPAYTVERAEGAIELRAYPSMTTATVTISGSRVTAINEGFRTLANYIFGENDGAKKIEMTAPVMESRSSAGDAAIGVKGDWIVRFVMPRSWSLDSLPKPRDVRVTLDTTPEARFAVIRFSGFWRDALLHQKTDELKAFMKQKGWNDTGAPIYAFYNPPWTLPMFRRNEIMIETR